jgi:hypothetical protein
VNEATITQATGLLYGALQPTDPKDKALRRCQATIGKATTAFLATRTQAIAKCWAAVSRAGGGSCPDSRATQAVTKARAKQAKAIQRACAGPDKKFATGDDPTPVTIGFPPSCYDIASCGGAVDSLPSLLDCITCVTEFDGDCADRAAAPFASSYPPECTVGTTTSTMPPTTTTTLPPLPECTAQRVVHIVAGNGGLAWFTLVWPLPAVITANNSSYSYDDVSRAALVPGTGAAHPLYARKIGTRTSLDGTGTSPYPTVFVAGQNETHTNSPSTTTQGSVEIVAAGAALQAGLQAPVPVVRINVSLYGPAPGAPVPAVATDVDTAIAAIAAATPISAEIQADLQPSATTLASWGIDGSTPAAFATLARNLLFAANAFRLSLVSTVVMRGTNDDPHGAYDGGTATATADLLTKILDGFYAELHAHTEANCGHGGPPVSLADNVVLVVSGDTFKNPFNKAGWADGTPGNSNLLYVRANGWLKPGWFGAIAPSTRTNFNPDTGELDPSALNGTPSSTAARLGLLFAIGRGNAAAVTAVSSSGYGGVVAAPRA